VLLKSPPGEAAIATWLQAFARELQAAGLGGAVRAVPQVREPDWIRWLRAPVLTAFVSYDHGPADADGLALCQLAVGWVRRHGQGDAYLNNFGMTLADPSDEIAQHLQLAAQSDLSAGISRWQAQPGPMARAQLAVYGDGGVPGLRPRPAGGCRGRAGAGGDAGGPHADQAGLRGHHALARPRVGLADPRPRAGPKRIA
jgi:hypothetical protein